MRYYPEYCINVPDDFPVDELTSFRVAAHRVLLQPNKAEAAWREFAGASNLIVWRYRASSENWLLYKQSCQIKGDDPDHEELYCRERAFFYMFTSGVSCIESTVYALAALASHPCVASISFGPTKHRDGSKPEKLCKWLLNKPRAAPLRQALSKLSESPEWKQGRELRNRMVHRSNIPRMIISPPPAAEALDYDATSSTESIQSGLKLSNDFHDWLTRSLTELLVGGTELCPT